MQSSTGRPFAALSYEVLYVNKGCLPVPATRSSMGGHTTLDLALNMPNEATACDDVLLAGFVDWPYI